MTSTAEPSTLTPVRLTLLALLPVCLLTLVLHGICLTEYGFFRDELYQEPSE